MSWFVRFLRDRLIQATVLVLVCLPAAGMTGEIGNSNDKVLAARALLDRYYGDPEILNQAETLLDEVFKSGAVSAQGYVEAARLTIMGGHLYRDRFQRDTITVYQDLLNRALAADPSNQKALILKAEAYSFQRDYPQEGEYLGKARALGTTDPWLWVGFARHSSNIGDYRAAIVYYSKVESQGPGTTATERKAYIASLMGLSGVLPEADRAARLRELAKLAARERDPADAWTLVNFADSFFRNGMFDDAIQYARDALHTMDFGAAHLTLAASLYCKAAKFTLEGNGGAAKQAIVEAKSQGVDPSDILEEISDSGDEPNRLLPIVKKLM